MMWRGLLVLLVLPCPAALAQATAVDDDETQVLLTEIDGKLGEILDRWEIGFDPDSEVEGDEQPALREQVDRMLFMLQVVGVALCWTAGLLSWKYFLYVKNHRDIW